MRTAGTSTTFERLSSFVSLQELYLCCSSMLRGYSNTTTSLNIICAIFGTAVPLYKRKESSSMCSEVSRNAQYTVNSGANILVKYSNAEIINKLQLALRAFPASVSNNHLLIITSEQNAIEMNIRNAKKFNVRIQIAEFSFNTPSLDARKCNQNKSDDQINKSITNQQETS